jgi:hypothetical protein
MWRPCGYSPVHSLTGPNHLLLTRGATICVPRMHPHLQVNWVLQLAMFLCIGDPNVMDHWPRWRPAASPGPMSRGDNWCDHTSLTYPGSIPLAAGPSSLQHTDWSEPLSICWGGALWRPCSYRFIYIQSHWSSGSTVCFPCRRAADYVLGKHQHNRTRFSC